MHYLLTLFAALSLFQLQGYATEARLRPANWATPVLSEHLQNWYQVDKSVYRSEQPDEEAMLEIERFGIKSILNLREHHDDKDEIKHTQLTPLHIPIRTDKINDDQVIKALRLIRNSEKPVLVHCWHGADRTGTVIAMYRMIEQGWSRKAAIDELVNGGYHYHSMFDNIITYLQTVDLQQIKRQLNQTP